MYFVSCRWWRNDVQMYNERMSISELKRHLRFPSVVESLQKSQRHYSTPKKTLQINLISYRISRSVGHAERMSEGKDIGTGKQGDGEQLLDSLGVTAVNAAQLETSVLAKVVQDLHTCLARCAWCL